MGRVWLRLIVFRDERLGCLLAFFVFGLSLFRLYGRDWNAFPTLWQWVSWAGMRHVIFIFGRNRLVSGFLFGLFDESDDDDTCH